jgi:hypothetical protein
VQFDFKLQMNRTLLHDELMHIVFDSDDEDSDLEEWFFLTHIPAPRRGPHLRLTFGDVDPFTCTKFYRFEHCHLPTLLDVLRLPDVIRCAVCLPIIVSVARI